MAKLVAVCRTDDYQFERRQLPLTVDDNLKMVVQFSDNCVDCEHVRGIKQKELEHFVQRFSRLTKDEVAVEMMVTSKDIMNLLTHMVPCVGCRRSVERLFNDLVESQHTALEPLIITRRGVLSVNRDSLFDPKALYALFYIHGSKLTSVMESIPKSKKNKRCNLHSLETHKTRTPGSWIDIWDLLAQDCREEVVLVDADGLLDTLENYLRKHRKPDDIESSVPSKRPRVTDPLHQELIDIERSSETTTSVTTPTKPKKERKWQSIWETEFKWLRKLTLPEGDQGYCAWCRDKKKSNSVANGCTNIQRSTWVKSKNHPDHKMVALAKQPSKQQPTLEKTTDVHITTHPCKEAQLRTMFFIIKANLPMHLHTELLNLQS
ncbi:Gametogenetin-binding protein 2 [Mytilus coruscus]|uniref:Gametogenetin-binding protein 2 n=1 Tax=Mytilus coruscus TaxID=42192 RepID=A0A6J8CGD1_MYTCO|nr:Gametogenetin-binding protein 2 [Mytilus coruscus]